MILRFAVLPQCRALICSNRQRVMRSLDGLRASSHLRRLSMDIPHLSRARAAQRGRGKARSPKGGGEQKVHQSDAVGACAVLCTFGVGLREEAPFRDLDLFALLVRLLLSRRRLGQLGSAACRGAHPARVGSS